MFQFAMTTKHVLKGLGRLAGAVVLAAGFVSAAHAQYVPNRAITLSTNVTSFDIGFVDTTLGNYYLASRDEAGIAVVDTKSLTSTVFGAGQFQGIKTSATSGPNGVITVNHREVWAGDGNGQVRVYDARNGAFVTTIEPGVNGPGPTPVNRADEACWDQRDNVVLWAWDEPADNFVAFINPKTHQVISTIKMDGAAGDGPKATGGIEQCQWDAQTDRIYLNLPEVNGPGTDTANGGVVVLDGARAAAGAGAIEAVWPIPVADCNGNAGMAIGPRREIGLNCGRSGVTNVGNGSVIISAKDGSVLATLPSVWGGDEMAFDASTGQYIFSGSNNNPPTLSIVQANPRSKISVTQTFPQAASEHSVAADDIHSQIFFPIVNSAAAQTQKYCSSLGGWDTKGCILVLKNQNQKEARNRDRDQD